MTTAHLILASATTGYVLMATWEERDLIRTHGEAYLQYREQVPEILLLGSREMRERAAVAAGD
jgi:protein-S-isoprenylcysteine O-methyltransferase Ste14